MTNASNGSTVVALPAQKTKYNWIALDSGAFKTISTWEPYFSLLTSTDTRISGIGGTTSAEGQGNFSFSVPSPYVNQTAGSTCISRIKARSVTSTGALFATKQKFNLLSVHSLCTMGYTVTFHEGGDDASITSRPDKLGVCTTFRVPFDENEGLYQLPIVPCSEEEELEEEEERILPSSSGLVLQNQCSCFCEHKTGSIMPKLSGTALKFLETKENGIVDTVDIPALAMSSVYSGSIPDDQKLHARLGHPGNNDALLKRLQQALVRSQIFRLCAQAAC